MTTKQLIAKLQELDPSGELKVFYEDYENGWQEVEPTISNVRSPTEARQLELKINDNFIIL